jgi:YesN/AraC family two-component response regulator
LFYSFAQEENNKTAAVLQLDYLTKPVGTAELVRALQRQGIAEKTVGQKTVVIADDDANLLDVHAAIVQDQSKCRVLRAANGREAWAQIKEHLPDLVLLDLMMPEMDGFAVLDAMQKLETTRRIPVIVLTGQTLTSDEMNRLNRGVATILAKGVFSVEETLGRIDQTLSNRKPLNSEAQNLARKAMTYIHEHFAQPVVRKDIAEYVRVSEDHLTRYFQHALGIPPMTYLTRYRIQRAKAMLDGGEMNITRIAAAVGFSNEFYFSRVFRREIGVTPSAYRRANARRA